MSKDFNPDEFLETTAPIAEAQADIERRNAIAKLLEEWGLVKIVNPQVMGELIAPLHQIKIISFREKDDWELVSKYNIGKKPQE